jgi:hypothetical protein
MHHLLRNAFTSRLCNSSSMRSHLLRVMRPLLVSRAGSLPKLQDPLLLSAGRAQPGNRRCPPEPSPGGRARALNLALGLSALLPVVDDIASAFNVAFSPEERRRDHDLASAATGVPNFTCEEVEDAAEDAFWAAEELMYREEFPAVARSTRVMANRRHGANGYLASGHLAARAGQSTPTPPQGRSKGPTRANASSESHNPTDQEHKPQGSSSKRKKKVKKNSRGAAGHLAAADASSAPDVKPIAAVVTDVASEGGGLVPAVPRGGES